MLKSVVLESPQRTFVLVQPGMSNWEPVMATKKSNASGKRRRTNMGAAVTTGSASAIATVQQTQGRLRITSTSSAGTPGEKGEHKVLVVRWDGDEPLSVKGWQVRDKRADHAYTFGDVTLKPHSTIRVHGGGSAEQDTETDVHWARGEDAWNEEGDVVHLLDSLGFVHAQYIFAAETGRKSAGRKEKRAAMASATQTKKVSVKKKATSQTAAKKKTPSKLRIVARACRFVGPKNEPEQEVVTIAWDGSRPLSLKGWKVYDSGAKHTYTFGDITMKAKSRLRLHTGGQDEVDTPTDVYWRQRNGVWNNEGDVLTVAEPDGKVSATYSYRGSGGAPALKKKKMVAVKKTPKASPTTAKAKPVQPAEAPRGEREKSDEPTRSELRTVPQTPRGSTPNQPPREPSGAAAQMSPSSQPDQQRQSARQSQTSEPNQPSGPGQPGAPSGAEPPSVPPSQGSPNDWKFTKPVLLLIVIAAFLSGVGITAIIAMSADSDTEVSLSEESLAEIASSQERAVQALVKRLTVEGSQEAIVAKPSPEAIERRPPSASAAIDAAIAATRRAKESLCSGARHAQRTADIDRAIAATKRAIVLLSDDDDD